MKILVAVDGSPVTKRMLAYLAAHDEWLGAAHDYTVLHAVAAVTSLAASTVGQGVVQQYYADASEKVFKPIRSFFNRQGIDAGFIGKVGHAHELIAGQARKGRFDLILMGSHGQGALGNLVMGSVATKVLATCSTPVLLIR